MYVVIWLSLIHISTNVRYLDNRRDMAQELFEGHIASYMTLGEAVVRGILPAPVYVSSVYSCLLYTSFALHWINLLVHAANFLMQ